VDDAESDGNLKGVDQRARPRAIVIVPTRELAKQVSEELAWLFAGLKTRIAAVTGGGGYRDELRAFRTKPAVIVGTPGRLLDHLNRGSIDAGAVGTMVLDEADRMLDLGFRDDIEAIFKFAPAERRTHLVSATFPREVKTLADRIQNNPANVEGTPLGTANLDIEHLIHLVDQRERLAAIINLLLEHAEGQTLIFARTRADVSQLSNLLQQAGFSIAMLSGEMEQAERNRALAAFKGGGMDALVATDVAARGIDVNDVTRVIHADPPTDSDAYTHRSGRTGRAGKKGISSILVTPRELPRTTALLGRSRVRWSFAPIPTAESLRDTRDTKLLDRLTADFVEGNAIDERSLALAERILNSAEPARAIGRLVQSALKFSAEAREVTPIRAPLGQGGMQGGDMRGDTRGEREPRDRSSKGGNFVRFRVSWGTVYGAEVRRLVAMICRRGNIEGRDIGAINLGRTSSVVEVSARVADAFERAAAKPDPRDPKIHIRRWADEPQRMGQGAPPREFPADPPSEPAIPAERPSRAAAKKERVSVRELPPAPPSSKKIPSDRPSRALAKKERVSVRELPPAPPSSKKERVSVRELPPAPPSSKEIPSDRPSRAASKKERVSVRELPPAPPSSKKERLSSARELPPAPPSSKAIPADRPSRAASKKERASVRELPEEPALFASDDDDDDDDDDAPDSDSSPAVEEAAPAKTAPASPAKKKEKKKKAEEVPFTPRENVIRRAPPAAAKAPREDRGPARDDRGPPPRDNRGPSRDDRGPARDDRGPPPRREDRGAPPRGPGGYQGDRPQNGGGYRGDRPQGGPPGGYRGDRPQGGPPGDRGAPRGDRPQGGFDRGAPPRGDRPQGGPPGDRGAPPRGDGPRPSVGKPPWTKGPPPPGGGTGPRRGPPPWERGAGNGPPKRRGPPR